MKELIIIATISFTLLFTSCKKQCSRCQNTCCKFTFVNGYFCSDAYASVAEYTHIRDSLNASGEIDCSDLSRISTFYEESCDEENLRKYEVMQGVTCVPLK